MLNLFPLHHAPLPPGPQAILDLIWAIIIGTGLEVFEINSEGRDAEEALSLFVLGEVG